MKKVLVEEVVSVPAGTETLPERVQVALGELVGAAKEGCWRCRSVLVWGCCTS